MRYIDHCAKQVKSQKSIDLKAFIALELLPATSQYREEFKLWVLQQGVSKRAKLKLQAWDGLLFGFQKEKFNQRSCTYQEKKLLDLIKEVCS